MKRIFYIVWILSVGIGRADHAPRAVLPDAVVDLRTEAGIRRLAADWRYSDTEIKSIEHHSVGPDLKATGPRNHTYDFTPDARAVDFDDSKWPVIAPDSLEQRRGNGRLSLNWYRISITLPEKIGEFDVRGSTAVFQIVVDDYAEISVNGKAPFVLGQSGGTIAAGWNAPNEVILTRDAQPGHKFQIAVLGINGPISTHPDTYIWIRSATVDFYSPGKLSKARPTKFEIDRKDPSLDELISPNAKFEKLAGGFTFTEGPVWVPAGSGQFGPDAADGFLLFSDPNNNVIYRMTPEGDMSLYMTKSGYAGENIGEYRQPGSNGLALDAQGRLTVCQHGNRRVVRIEKNGLTTILADRFEGKRLNSPNDLVYRSDGALFFTDPPFGLPKFHKDPRRETSFSGVYSLRDGRLQLLATELSGPNGLAFSPDEKYLYVGNWDDQRKIVNRYAVNADATLGKGELFCDLTGFPGEDAIDGIKVDCKGNVFVSGPGGLSIFSPAGKHLGLLHGPEHPHNMAWGDADRQSLYLAAQTGLYRVRVNNPGAGAKLREMANK